jgi:hypothetical protein
MINIGSIPYLQYVSSSASDISLSASSKSVKIEFILLSVSLGDVTNTFNPPSACCAAYTLSCASWTFSFNSVLVLAWLVDVFVVVQIDFDGAVVDFAFNDPIFFVSFFFGFIVFTF